MLKGGAGKEKDSSKESSKLSESNSEKDNFSIAALVSKTKPEAIHLVFFFSLRHTQNRQIDDTNTTHLSGILFGTGLRGMS